MRINVSCSRADFDAFPVSSSSRSAVHRPNFGRGWTSRSYSKDVSPDRRTLRTVLRDTLRSRAISLLVLPLIKCSRRIRAIVSSTSIPPHLLRLNAGSANRQPIAVHSEQPLPHRRWDPKARHGVRLSCPSLKLVPECLRLIARTTAHRVPLGYPARSAPQQADATCPHRPSAPHG